jgi:hypothetical protein
VSEQGSSELSNPNILNLSKENTFRMTEIDIRTVKSLARNQTTDKVQHICSSDGVIDIYFVEVGERDKALVGEETTAGSTFAKEVSISEAVVLFNEAASSYTDLGIVTEHTNAEEWNLYPYN